MIIDHVARWLRPDLAELSAPETLRRWSRPAILRAPMTAGEATAQVESWLGAPAAVAVAPIARHPRLLRGLLCETGTGGNLTSAAQLAALAVEHGEIVSYDRDSSNSGM